MDRAGKEGGGWGIREGEREGGKNEKVEDISKHSLTNVNLF